MFCRYSLQSATILKREHAPKSIAEHRSREIADVVAEAARLDVRVRMRVSEYELHRYRTIVANEALLEEKTGVQYLL